MNRIFTLLAGLLMLSVLYSCTKISGHSIAPGSGTTTGTTTTGTTTPASGIDTTKGYQPVTANSYTKYREVIGTSVDTLTNTITGATSTINNKLYSVVTNVSKTYGTSTGYYSDINHVYTARGTSVIQGITLEIEYLIDNVPVGSTWNVPVTDNGMINGVPARLLGVITEKGVSKTVSGTIFSNVIHTTLQLQYDYGTGFTTSGTYEYYVAKGVGVIESDASISAFGSAAITSTTVIIGFSIK